MLIVGKGAKEAVLPITGETWAAMLRYRNEVGHHHGPLIRSLLDPTKGISGHHVSALVTGALIEAGVKIPGDPSRTAHSTRHSFAHDILMRTRDIRAVQQALRHESVATTEIYLRGQVSDLREAMEGRSYLDAA